MQKQSSNGIGVVSIRYNPSLKGTLGKFNPIPLFHWVEIKYHDDYDTILHEFGHMIGLQDLDMNNNPWTHISLMGYASELAYLATADIKLNDVIFEVDSTGNLITDTTGLLEWKPINNFKGIFEGNNFTITGLYINKSADISGDNSGLFGLTSGQYYNLHVSNAYVKGNEKVGGIFATYSSSKGMRNISFSGTVVGVNMWAEFLGIMEAIM